MCVILYTNINGKKILAKNRDRPYKPEIQIIHEIVNGIEVVYLKDEISGWIEGMNANGVGMVNSTMDTTHSDKRSSKKGKKSHKKRNVIYNSLINNQQHRNFYDIINEAKHEYILEGHTLVYHNDEIFHIENTNNNNFIAEMITKPVVYTNNGIRITDAGYTKCIKGMSSYLRAVIMQRELKNHTIHNEDELLNLMNINYTNVDARFHPYRDKYYSRKRHSPVERKRITISTTGQILMNMTDKIFMYYTDINNSENVKYINRLPREYVPQIRIIIKETEKNLKNKKKILTQKYLREMYKKFDCKRTRKAVLGNHRKSGYFTRKNRNQKK